MQTKSKASIKQADNLESKQPRRQAGSQYASKRTGKEINEPKLSRNVVDHFMNGNQLKDR